jgi:hypothetical protein
MLSRLIRTLSTWRPFPLPSVSTMEHLLLRIGLAYLLFHFFPWSVIETTQPQPVGLAHFFDLTWQAQPELYSYLRIGFYVLLFAYAAGVYPPIILPLLSVIQLLPYTLGNSQGHPHHGYQIISLPLCALAFHSLYHARQHHITHRQLIPLILALPIGWGWKEWGLSVPHHHWIHFMWAQFGIGWGSALITVTQLSVFTLICLLLAHLHHSTLTTERYRSTYLFTAQWVIGAAYFVSVCSKFKESHFQWLSRSHYIVLDMVKAARQTYYSTLDPLLKTDPPSIHFFMEHAQLTRLFFNSGLFLEALILFATGTRKLALIFGISAIVMHESIRSLMTLNFYTNEAMLLLFFVNLPYWITRLRQCRSAEGHTTLPQ